MTESSQTFPPEEFSDLVEEKAAGRRRDAEDIAAGRRTPEEVQHENAWFVPNPAGTIIVNEYEACGRL